MKPPHIVGITVVTIAVFFIVLLVATLFFGPIYKVWKSGKDGEATLKRAESEKQVMIETAKAEVEAAELRARAIELVGEAAQKYPEYREQEFIAAFGEAIQSGSVNQIIYVPTEANIPIIEAGGR